jgi:acyl carrier protein
MYFPKNGLKTAPIRQTRGVMPNINEIKEILREHFKTTVGFAPGDSDNLFEKGALDSFGVVEFLTFLETRFGLAVPIEDVTEAQFSTLDSVADLVHRNVREG